MTFIFNGIVQKGNGHASRLSFPTVNIPLEDVSLSGIYAARVTITTGDAPYMAAAFADPKRGVLEAHVLDFPPKDGSASGGRNDLVGMHVTIELVEKLRESKQFDDEAELRKAIVQDVVAVRAFFTET